MKVFLSYIYTFLTFFIDSVIALIVVVHVETRDLFETTNSNLVFLVKLGIS